MTATLAPESSRWVRTRPEDPRHALVSYAVGVCHYPTEDGPCGWETAPEWSPQRAEDLVAKHLADDHGAQP